MTVVQISARIGSFSVQGKFIPKHTHIHSHRQLNSLPVSFVVEDYALRLNFRVLRVLSPFRLDWARMDG